MTFQPEQLCPKCGTIIPPASTHHCTAAPAAIEQARPQPCPQCQNPQDRQLHNPECYAAAAEPAPERTPQFVVDEEEAKGTWRRVGVFLTGENFTLRSSSNRVRIALAAPEPARDSDIPLCARHAETWFTSRNHLNNQDCVVCAHLPAEPVSLQESRRKLAELSAIRVAKLFDGDISQGKNIADIIENVFRQSEPAPTPSREDKK